MPHSTIDFSKRAPLTERMDEPCSREEMRACLRDIDKLNRWMLGYMPTMNWLNAIRTNLPLLRLPLSILDVGCGDGEALRFLQWMEKHAEIGWFINDLSRSEFAYRFIRVFTRMAWLHPFVQQDAPISIARSFVPDDWQRLCGAAGLKDAGVEIFNVRPARLCLARRKPL
jgi:SAM-dependent methyltransferase